MPAILCYETTEDCRLATGAGIAALVMLVSSEDGFVFTFPLRQCPGVTGNIPDLSVELL